MIGDKDLERAHIRKEPHLIHTLHHSIHDLILERFQYNSLILDLKRSQAIAIMDLARANLLHGDDGDDVAVPAGAGSFDLAVQLDTEDVVQVGAEELWLERQRLD